LIFVALIVPVIFTASLPFNTPPVKAVLTSAKSTAFSVNVVTPPSVKLSTIFAIPLNTEASTLAVFIVAV